MKRKTKWFRKCPKCKTLIFYCNKYTLKRAINNKYWCQKCKAIEVQNRPEIKFIRKKENNIRRQRKDFIVRESRLKDYG